MKKAILAVALFTAFNAYADSTHENTTTGGNLENTINNAATSNSSSIANGGAGIGIGLGGSGGQGGRGGDGGNAFQNQGQNQGQSQSISNSGNSQSNSGVYGSGNSSNHNSNTAGVVGSGNSDNRNTNTNGVYGSGNSDNRNTTVSNATGGYSKATGGNSYSAGGKATGGNATGGNSGGNTQANAVNVQGDHVEYRAAASTAYAAPIAPTVNCASTASVGVQGLSFGISAGGSYKDTNCEKLEQARFAAQVLGNKEAASLMLEEISPAYAKAMRKARGEPEPQAAVETQSVDLYKQ